MAVETISARDLLRHSVATIAYRGGKTVRDAPRGYVDFQAGGNVRTPIRILTHIGDLIEWALSMAQGKRAWRDSEPLSWPDEVERFFDTLKAFDDYLASSEPLHAPAGKLLQGPIADALHHVGQLAMLRRIAGNPIRGENYYMAEVTAGRVGREQAPPRMEFD